MMKKKLLTTALLSCLFALPCFSKADAFDKETQAMNVVYGKFNSAKNCWIVRDNDRGGLHYCMRFMQAHSVPMSNGNHTVYMLATGNALEDIGETRVAGGGLFGFIVYQTDGHKKFRIIASKPKIEGGQYGQPPESGYFTFVKLGTNQYGWRLDEPGFANGGPQWTSTDFYTLYKGAIRNVFSLLTDSSYYNYDREEQITEKNRTVEIQDSGNESNGFYPLRITVHRTGHDDLSPGTYTVRFDANRNKYVAPMGSPLARELDKN